MCICTLKETKLKQKDLQIKILVMSEQIKRTLNKYMVYIFTIKKKSICFLLYFMNKYIFLVSSSNKEVMQKHPWEKISLSGLLHAVRLQTETEKLCKARAQSDYSYFSLNNPYWT